jgi:hypothetical protein
MMTYNREITDIIKYLGVRERNNIDRIYGQYSEFFKEWLFVDAPYPGGGERC